MTSRKRKRDSECNPSAPNKRPKRMSQAKNLPTQTPATIKQPTNFLTLPRELRQQILYLSRPIILYVEDLEIKPMYRHIVAYYNEEARSAEIERIDDRVVELGSVDATGVIGVAGVIEEDLEYVLRKWEEDLERLVEESEKGRRYLLSRGIVGR
ncbi:hypothetical protein E6O75_ATG05729 [Venturia nashicola]|uniref:Uncharacterized protein n=1 Tax=Venturia nashicola TaxID=86259 RepID=A0A4Z1PH50_9PEZI|nr:hypothetical protein E6O75_ATG05729 [Venturia nashicola]